MIYMLLEYSQATPFARENTALRSVKFVRKVPRQQRQQFNDAGNVYDY